MTVRITIDQIHADGCTDTTSGADFYARIAIGDQSARFPNNEPDSYVEDNDDITPAWTLERQYDLNATSSTTASIRVWDYDSGLNFGDDDCDANPNAGLAIDLNVTLLPCTLSGNASGPCRQVVSKGNDEGDGDVTVTYTVEVDPPASSPGLAVRCLQSPLWPQPGDTVTITVESLDGHVQVGDTLTDTSNGAANPLPLVDRKKVADSLEIWTADAAGKKVTVASGTAKSTLSTTLVNVTAGDLTYSCKAKAGSDFAFTGWRKTRVGPPADGSAIPVIYTGDRKNRVDIVLVADSGSYTSASDAAFLTDAAYAVKGAYYGQDYFLANQQWFNIWLADQRGKATGVSSTGSCGLTAPANWAQDYSWRDAGAILHSSEFRDCASNGLFSTEFNSLATMLHESGHAPFGLADEYGGDGGYFVADPLPNLYAALDTCKTDAPNLGRPASDCRKITDTRSDPDVDWYLSDPGPDDLMSSRRPPNGAEITGRPDRSGHGSHPGLRLQRPRQVLPRRAGLPHHDGDIGRRTGR